MLLALRVIVALGVVIAVIWYLRRRNSATGKDRRARKPITVVARQNLAPKVSVAVVDFGGKRFLLGVSEHGVTVLHDEEQETADELSVETFAQTLSVAERAAATGRPTAGTPVTGAPVTGTPTPVRLARDKEIDAAFAGTSSKLAGSVLSAATWKQAWTAIRAGR